MRATSHMIPMTMTSALSLVETAEPVQVRFTLYLRDRHSMWMQGGCQSLHGFLRGIKWIMFHGHLDYFQKPPLGGRPNTKPGDHGTPNTHNHWFILCYHAWRPAWIEIHWNNIICLRAWSHMTSHRTWARDHMTWFWKCFGMSFRQFLLGSHDFNVTALGSCVKWPWFLKRQKG